MSIIRVIRKLNIIQSKNDRVRIAELFILMFIGGLLECASVGLIIPFMDALVNIDTIMEKWYVKMVCRALGLQYPFTFLFVVAVSLGLLFILKSIFLVFENNIQYRFSYSNMLSIQHELLKNIVSRPYEYFLYSNSGEVVRLLNTDVRYVSSLMMGLLSLFTELCVSAMLVTSILIIMPKISLIIAGVLIAFLSFTDSIIKPKLKKAGEEAVAASTESNKWILQAVNGVKEMKIMNMETFFCEQYCIYARKLVKSDTKNAVLSIIPRYMIEGICMSVMFFVIAILIITGSRFDDVMPILSSVAMAAIRLLPSVNRISAALAQISYGEPMIDNVIDGIKQLDETTEEGYTVTLSDEKVPILETQISFNKITYNYPNTEGNVLTDTSFEIQKGEFVGIIGSSGAGKTTVVDIILGLIKPRSGQVLVDGYDISNDIKGWHNEIGYIPQTIFMLDGSIRDNVVFGRGNNDRMVWETLDNAALEDFVRSLPNGLDTQIGERGIRLSGGQRQRIGIARALYSNPEILFFDEATSALDNETETAIMESINGLKGRKTMIIIAHRLTTIENCDHVYRVEDGKIVKER